MKKNKKNTTKIKVRDFKMWLSGFLDFQGEEWVPNKEQWALIKSKLELLEDEAIRTPPENVKIHTQPVRPTRQYQPQDPSDQEPVSFTDQYEDIVVDDTMPPIPSGLSPQLTGSTGIKQHKTKITDTTVTLPNGIPKSPFL